jgi:DNA-directed RNA polymerase subunit RPC12/RpoP
MGYDDTQAKAALVQCPRCGRRVYATHPKAEHVCIRCRDAERKAEETYTPTLGDA